MLRLTELCNLYYKEYLNLIYNKESFHYYQKKDSSSKINPTKEK